MSITTIRVGAATIKDGKALFPITREGDLSQESAVRYQTHDGSALGQGDLPKPGANYQAASGTKVFEAGVADKTVTVQLLEVPASGQLSFSLNLLDSTFGTIATATGTAKIGTAPDTSTVGLDQVPSGRELPIPTIEAIQVPGGVTAARPHPLTVAAMKDFHDLVAKHSLKSNGQLDPVLLLAVQANLLGQMTVLQDATAMTSERMNAVINANMRSGALAMRKSLQKPTPPHPLEVAMKTGAGSVKPA